MTFKASEGFLKKAMELAVKNEPSAAAEAFIEGAADSRVENRPLLYGVIRVRGGQCRAHWKNAEGWKEEGGKL
jgi:hypothetical protein